MTNPSVLDFFVLEAGEYVQQLDGTLHSASTDGPDASALQRAARALRGSATMARQAAIAGVASGIERVARALGEGRTGWETSLQGVLVAAVDDLKIFLQNVRAWSAADADRATARSAELARYAPEDAPRTGGAQGSGQSFFIAEATNIAAGLELLVTRPDDRDTAAQVLTRARALRGVAGVSDVLDLAEVLDATDDAARELERGDRPLTPESERVLRAAAAVLRVIAGELREGKTDAPNSTSAERMSFSSALDAWMEGELERERVVPIGDLFFHDQGPHVVQRSTQPPTSSAERFRLELISRGEHLRGLLDEARGRPNESPGRDRRMLRRALVGVAGVAASFGEAEIATLVEEMSVRIRSPEQPLDLAAVARLADALCTPGEHGERVRTQLELFRELGKERPVEREVPMRRNTPPVGAIIPPADVFATLEAGIAAISKLQSSPLAEPAALQEIEIVPVDTLLYRGDSALQRARELQDSLRSELRRGGVISETVDELFDLLDLAAAR